MLLKVAYVLLLAISYGAQVDIDLTDTSLKQYSLSPNYISFDLECLLSEACDLNDVALVKEMLGNSLVDLSVRFNDCALKAIARGNHELAEGLLESDKVFKPNGIGSVIQSVCGK